MCCEIGCILKFIKKFVKNVVSILVADICSLPNSLLYRRKKKSMNYYRVYNSSLSFVRYDENMSIKRAICLFW